VELTEGAISRQFAWSYRVIKEDGAWVLQALQDDRWQDQYAFNLEPHYPIDFEVANYFTSTHPSSIFVKSLIVQIPGPEARMILRNRELSVKRVDGVSTRAIANDEELLQILATHFGLEFAEGTRFRCLTAAP
jgi:N-hydroxyarylamine O-acetyltransferase